MESEIKAQKFLFFGGHVSSVLFQAIYGKFGQKWCLVCFDLKKMRPKWNEMQSFFEVIFLVFFRQVSGNLGKILRTPKNLPTPAPMKGCGLSGLALFAKGRFW